MSSSDPEGPTFSQLAALAASAVRVLREAYERDDAFRAAVSDVLKHTEPHRPADGHARPSPSSATPRRPASVNGPSQAKLDLPLHFGGANVRVTATGSPAELRQAEATSSTPAPAPAPANTPARPSGEAQRPTTYFDAGLVARRCRLKARAARWQYERDALPRDEMVAGDEAIIREAKSLLDCFTWMCSPSLCRTRTREAMDLVAGAYEVVADAAELVGSVDHNSSEETAFPDRPAVELLAEAQSMLHVILARTRSGTGVDTDQLAAFILARETGKRRHYRLQYLALDDPADPAEHAALRTDIARLRAEREDCDRRRRSRDNLLNKVAYEAGKLLDLGAPLDTASRHFRTIGETVETLLAEGLAPSDPRLRDALLPLLPLLPTNLPENHLSPALRRAFDAVDDYLDRVEDDDEADPTSPSPRRGDDALRARARRLAEGRHAVLLGGQPIERHRESIERELGLQSLTWLGVEHGKPFDAAERELRREEVSLAFLMTRWRSHRDGPAVRAVTRERNIPLVELPAGYNWRTVAHHLTEQAGDRLGTDGDG